MFSLDTAAQSRKSKPADKKAASAKKNDKASRDARKADKRDASRNKDSAKNDKRDKRSKDRDKASARDKRDKNDRSSRADKNDKKQSRAESRAALAERRRIEAERRAAAEAERRRREQARREAIARKLAFERGLRTETVANIANDRTEGEDLRIRQAAINALGDHAGSVVVMEAQTGKILTIVNQDWAVRSSIRPCSTIKLVTGVAGLNEGVISKENGAIKDTSTRRDLDAALAFSDNPYFQRAGVKMGNQKLVEYGRKLGLGEPTGVNLEGETGGRLPYSNSNPRIYSHGDDTEVSTIQLAVMAAAITNGGYRVLPRVPRNSIEKTSFQPFYRARVDLPRENVRRVIPGMMGAAEYGTARRNMNQDLGVAGKTGSCIDKGSWVGLFASVAPVEQPKYAVAVITRGQRERGRYAAAVAAQIYNALAGGIVRTDRNLAQTEFRLAPRNPSQLRTVPITDDEDEDTDSTMAAEGAGSGEQNDAAPAVVMVPARPEVTSPSKLVKRTADSKPLFAPVVITPEDEAKKKRERYSKPQ